MLYLTQPPMRPGNIFLLHFLYFLIVILKCYSFDTSKKEPGSNPALLSMYIRPCLYHWTTCCNRSLWCPVDGGNPSLSDYWRWQRRERRPDSTTGNTGREKGKWNMNRPVLRRWVTSVKQAASHWRKTHARPRDVKRTKAKYRTLDTECA